MDSFLIGVLSVCAGLFILLVFFVLDCVKSDIRDLQAEIDRLKGRIK
jgi:hypothetical protein